MYLNKCERKKNNRREQQTKDKRLHTSTKYDQGSSTKNS
jgi:hypothetical protein